MATNSKLQFCENFLFLDRSLIKFDGRPFLDGVYASRARNLVIRASRQVEKSTFLVNTILYEASTTPGTKILFVCPRIEQARVFSHTRLLPSLEQSPLIRRTLIGTSKKKLQVTNMRFANDSQLFIRAAYHSADAARGISADILLVDEFQDIAAGNLPVLQETLSHARNGRTILTGTPKLIDNHLEAMFSQSTANEWTLKCAECESGVILNEHCIAPTGIECPKCHVTLKASDGRWIPRNPYATWGDGFWINHLMVPWINYDEIIDRRQIYDLAKFKNEVLGLPTNIGEHVVTREELEACCNRRPMANSVVDIPPASRNTLIAGVDWGGGSTSRTVVVLGSMRSDFTFEIYRFFRFSPDEDPDRLLTSVAKVCEHFGVRAIAADGGGNGHVFNRLLLDRLGYATHLYAILYSAVDQQPRQEGSLWKWTVNRSATIGTLFSRIKKKMLSFPRKEDCGSFLDEFACEVAEYDDINRTVRYTHPETQQDDALHAANYALLLGIRGFQKSD
jgi:hypothetical protein